MKLGLDFDDNVCDTVHGWIGNKKAEMLTYTLPKKQRAELMAFIDKATPLLKPVPGVRHFIDKYWCSPNELIVITAREGSQLEQAKKWMTSFFPTIKVYSKKDYPEVDFIIDDHPEGYELKCRKVFLFSQPWNKEETKYDRFDNWDEALQTFGHGKCCVCGDHMLYNCKESAKRCIGCGLVIYL